MAGELPDWATDDLAIQGEIRLLRRVPEFLVHDGVVESSNFRETEEGRGLTVTVWAAPSDLEAVLRLEPSLGVVCITAQDIRDVGAQIVRVPLVGNLNHCEIFPRLTPSPLKKIKKAARWVHYPTWVSEEHRGDIAEF